MHMSYFSDEKDGYDILGRNMMDDEAEEDEDEGNGESTEESEDEFV